MPTHEAFNIPIVALEGLDGVGKTALFDTLATDPDLLAAGVHFTGEFKSRAGELLKRQSNWQDDPVLKLYGFAADRAFLFRAIAALEPHPKLIVWDRYVDSAVAYREGEKRLGRSPYGAAEARAINALFPRPVRVLYLSVPVDKTLQRKPGDRLLLEKVATVYDDLARERSYVTVDATRSADEVANDAKREILKLL